MTNATAMNTNWGMDQIGDNLFNASATAWKASAGGASDLAFGFIPVMLAIIIFVRFKKVVPALFAMGLSTSVLKTFELLGGLTTNVLYMITVFGLVVYFMQWLRNR